MIATQENIDATYAELSQRSFEVFGYDIFGPEAGSVEFVNFERDNLHYAVAYTALYFNPDSNCGGSWVSTSGTADTMEFDSDDDPFLSSDINRDPDVYIDIVDNYGNISEEFLDVCEQVFTESFDYTGGDSRHVFTLMARGKNSRNNAAQEADIYGRYTEYDADGNPHSIETFEDSFGNMWEIDTDQYIY